ncbi:hypothetical protein P3X46_010387 [Hevea brasiliensis]|uniref:DC1 domain-containing protein n=1 Tax=Hevea brasiliensis TaxID=3981 RepID=A0ABQ9MHZ3_HEVBR|nr:hypothetical protein P3X46_010387 [Hevea brasiliensis]
MEALQFPFPLLIAIKDDSADSSKIAYELADFLKCPFINQNDISRAFLIDDPSFKFQHSNKRTYNLAFDTVCQIASIQLSLKIKVIVNVMLSNPVEVLKLAQLASSREARLIIISCETKDNNNDGYYIVERINNLRVDTQSLDVRKVVSDMFTLISRKERNKAMKEIDSHKKNKNMRQPVIDHLHALTLSEKPGKENFVCKRCSRLLSDHPSYGCVDCDEFNLHISCAESAPNIKHYPSFLAAIQLNGQYDFQQTHKCSNCEEFSYDCCDCFLQTHLNLGLLPTILYPKQHPHFLNFIIMPSKYNHQYKCCICDKLGSSVSYKCYDCFYDVHLNCVLPAPIQVKNGHRFILTSYPADIFGCDICNEEIEMGQLFYDCSDALINIHLRCMFDEGKVNDMINKELVQPGIPLRMKRLSVPQLQM